MGGGAEVKIDDGMGGYDTHSGNSSSDQIWEITCLKGDLNNDNAINAFDIDPFVLALASHAPGGAYDQAFPGLLGSVIYHADMDCDGDINAFDIDPFALRLGDASAYCAAYYDSDTCYDCYCATLDSGEGSGGGYGLEPAELAELFQENVAAERLGLIIDAAAELAASYADTPRGEYWSAVLAELE